MLKADINHITRLRIGSDGAGVRSVVFMQHCPLNCFWCCNPQTRFGGKFRTLTTTQLHEYISRDIPYFFYSSGGVTFSGGEPLMYADFIKEYIEQFCTGFSVNVETSLYAETEKISQLSSLVDEWYIDFKVFDKKRHIDYTGQSNEKIKSNLIFLSRNIDVQKITITLPMITEYNTSRQNLVDTIAFLQKIGITRVSLHPYRKDSEDKHKELDLPAVEVPETSIQLYNSIKEMFVNSGFNVLKRESPVERAKCKYLKHIRKEICEAENLNVEIKDCSFNGACVGTCPQCEYELETIAKHLKSKVYKEDKDSYEHNEM